MPVNTEKLRIVHYPHPVLRQKAQEIPKVTDEIQAIARRMLELMHEDGKGVGLAAPQVGLPIRLFVVNETQEPGDDKVYINPVLSVIDPQSMDEEEGCLSLPRIRAKVRRPTKIHIRALDLDGNPFEQTSDDFLARVWQHEFDHLEGVLIIDKMSLLDRMANKRAIKELESRKP